MAPGWFDGPPQRPDRSYCRGCGVMFDKRWTPPIDRVCRVCRAEAAAAARAAAPPTLDDETHP